MVGLLASGGSTNSAMHLLVFAAAAGIHVTWDDYDALSAIVPLLARVYPNGEADVNAFDAAGGVNALIAQLLEADLLHQDVTTVAGTDLSAYTQRYAPNPQQPGTYTRVDAAVVGTQVLRVHSNPFDARGGLTVLYGALGQSIIKTSAVASDKHRIEAPALVFDSQEAFLEAYQQGKCNRDCIAVVRFQGPKANGMPELHKLIPPLGVLQDKGYKVALVTDGRLSGASGKVPAAIHLTPEAADGGLLAKIHDGDRITLDANTNTLSLDNADAIAKRPPATMPDDHAYGCGRELFANFRSQVTPAANGASQFGHFFG